MSSSSCRRSPARPGGPTSSPHPDRAPHSTMSLRTLALAAVAVTLGSARAWAQLPTPEPIGEGDDGDVGPALPPSLAELDERIQRAEQMALNRQPAITWGGYLDFGFFVPAGQRRRLRRRTSATALYPEYAQLRLGLPGRHPGAGGELARRGRRPGRRAPGVDRFDSINSRGAPGFVAQRGRTSRSRSALTADGDHHRQLQPRARAPAATSASATVFDLDIAQLEWMPTASQRTSFFVGKIGLGHRHRVPRAQVRPALRHHAVADRALHDRHRAGAQGAHQARHRRLARAGRARSPTARTPPSSSTSTTRSTATPARPLSGRVVAAAAPGIDLELGALRQLGRAGSRALERALPMWFCGPDLHGPLRRRST